MTLVMHSRGWRDGWWGREPRSACEVYLDAWEAGLRDRDRHRARLVASALDPNASGSLLVPAPGPGMQAGQEQGPPSAASGDNRE